MTQFIFIDESGDPGNILTDGASSSYYAELALQINKETFPHFAGHVVAWQYLFGRFNEIKTLPSKAHQLKRYIDPFIQMCDDNSLCCSCVYLIKENYTGPYLKGDKYKPIWFRNFVHRQLLEHHFKCFPARNDDIELVFDRYRMSKDDIDNLEKYLRENRNLPYFRYISHINSLFSGVTQVTSQLVDAMKDIISGTADENKKTLLSWIKLKDITRL